MSISRREFLKITGLSTLAGLAGTAGVHELLKSGSEASQVPSSIGALSAKKWAMVIDMRKLRTEEAYKKIINACHSIHNVPDIGNIKEEVKWIWKEKFENVFPGQGNEYMEENLRQLPFLVLCNHCDKPACVRVCPTKATFKRQDGLVMMDMHRCIGCRFCMAACPYGARSFNWRDPRPFINKPNPDFPTRTKGVVEKCTFCYERLAKGKMPACVEASDGALIFGDLADPNSEVRKIISSHYTIRRKPELGTGPNIYYLTGDNKSA